MNIGKKVLCILMASMVCIALQFMCSINVYAQETTEDVVTADPLPLTVPAGWTPTPIDEGTKTYNQGC